MDTGIAGYFILSLYCPPIFLMIIVTFLLKVIQIIRRFRLNPSIY